MKKSASLVFSALLASGALTTFAQDRLPSYPGYKEHEDRTRAATNATVKLGALTVTWSEDSKGFDYQWDGKSLHYDIPSNKVSETGAAAADDGGAGNARGRRGGRGGGGRGGRGGGVIGGGGGLGGGGIARQQSAQVASPDGKLTGFVRDGNLWVRMGEDAGETQITTDATKDNRVRNGVATIVYGEELGMTVGMWWSPDSKKLAYYRFDESKVPDYVVTLQQSKQYNNTEIDPYPKAGVSSPPVDLYVYDVATKKSVKMDVRDGKEFEDSVLGYYVYRLAWSPDGKELFFSRMNRRQSSLDLAAANPDTGKCRVIVHEEWPANWTDWAPGFTYLRDRQRFIWTSERNGFKNYYLYDLSGKLIAKLTDNQFEVANLVKIDEEANLLFYMARDGENYMKLQLHRVGLDGKGDKRLTDPKFNHSISLAPDNQHFIDIIQTHDQAPATRLVDAEGKVIAELAKSDTSKFDSSGFKQTELFTFMAGDGKTELHGMLDFPSNFDPNKKYPLLVNVYGGPITSRARETYSGRPNLMTDYGFLVANFDARSLSGRGRKFSDPFYGHLGIVEMDDHAAGVRELDKRPYVDKNRVGVFGTSYGGTTAATLLMRFPDLFQAASSSSPVTDYRNYNNIYGERYQGLVSDNKEGYDAATVMTYVPNMKGRLLLYFGTADNNVHVSNSLQLIQALQAARKSFDLQIGPDRGHTGVDNDRMMEFFIENLVLKGSVPPG